MITVSPTTRRVLLITWGLSLIGMVLLMERTHRLRGRLDEMLVQEEQTKKKADELQRSSDQLNASVRAFIDGEREEESPITEADEHVFGLLVEAGVMSPRCPPDPRARCGAVLLHWEHAHFRDDALACLYDGGTVRSCPP